ncbi:MAG: hypothetical protein OXI74_21335 [Rhodospirillaceae bacterium]|nr:hypothetical protein [Rhodospirillaceae bacterium]
MAEKQPGTVRYLRASREERDLDKNRAGILALANREDLGRVEFVEEKASGRIAWRERGIAGVLDELGEIASDAGVRAHAVKGSWRLDEAIRSGIIAMAFSMAAEIERGPISARTGEALGARKAAGLPLGRPKGPGKSKLDPNRPEIEALLANRSTQKFIAKRYGATAPRPPTSRTGSERTESGSPRRKNPMAESVPMLS